MSNEIKTFVADSEAPHHNPLTAGEVYEHDAVFGEITDSGPNYRNVGWLGSTALMIKTQIGLGVLSMPSVFDVLGIIPGIIVLITVAAMTSWSGYMVGVFKLNHRDVYGIDDVGKLLFGRIGHEVFGGMYALFYTCVSGSAMLSISIALNALSDHGTCTAVFVAVAAITTFMFASIRTLARISWLAWIGAICIIIAVFIVTIAVGLQDRPSAAPKDMVWKSDYKLVGHPTFTQAISAVSTLVFTYSGAPAFFNIIAEMRDPEMYPRSLAICQTFVTVIYIVVATVVYYYCGTYVSSPALGSAGPIIKKVAYGIAFPGLIVTSVLLLHLPAKHIFVRILRGTKHLTASTTIHWVTWFGCTSTVSVIAYVIASGIPVFGGLVSLIGALLGTLLSFHPYGCMWLYDNWKKERTVRWHAMAVWSVFMIVLGTFLLIGGTYGTIYGIIESYREDGGVKPWSCADNSNS